MTWRGAPRDESGWFHVSPSNDKNVTRIDELETRLALQDDSIRALSDEIYLQQKRIAQLEGHVRELLERLRSLMARSETDAGAEKPPHY
jgi:SlyX protein